MAGKQVDKDDLVVSSVDSKQVDSAAAQEQELFTTPPSSKEEAARSSMSKKMLMVSKAEKKILDHEHRRSLLARVDDKMRVVLMALLLPPLMPVSGVCHWALSSGFHLAWSSSMNVRSMLERRRHLLTPSQAAVARVLPTAMLWCGVAGMAAAALALLLGARGRGRLALAYVALAAAAANHCLCARLFALMLVADDTGSLDIPLAIISTSGIIFFATMDLVGFHSLRKAATAEEADAQ